VGECSVHGDGGDAGVREGYHVISEGLTHTAGFPAMNKTKCPTIESWDWTK
jgi:hypothetical protein